MSDSPGSGLRLKDVKKTFHQGARSLDVLSGVDFTVEKGEMVALVGPSGAGKSTLLHIAGLLEGPDSGEIEIDGRTTLGLPDDELTALRSETIGFVYQYHHLLPEFSALENVVLPQMIAGQSRRKAAERSLQLLTVVGLSERAQHRPAELSGGEQQRVAIVRALANRPSVLLADEPTGNLDPHTADDVFELLISVVRNAKLAAVVATHNYELARRMDRILRLEEGGIVEGL